MTAEHKRIAYAAGRGVLLFLLVARLAQVFYPPDTPATGYRKRREPEERGLPSSVLSLPKGAALTEDHYARIIEEYGTPEVDWSTAYDRPRPMLVTRWVEYKPENLQVAFIANAKAFDPPPYAGWGVIGYINTRNKKAMSSYDAADVLRPRWKKIQSSKQK